MSDLIGVGDDAPDLYDLKPGKSKVLVQIIEGDSYLFHGYLDGKPHDWNLDIEELQFEGGSASIENEAGMLKDAIVPLMEPDFWRPGWFLIDGFYGYFSRDYYGEVDCDFECDDIREATDEDMSYFGVSNDQSGL